jgi:hypothetical protein
MKKRKVVPEDGKYIRVPTLKSLDADLRIKLNFDDITKFFFFNEYIKGYLLEDEELMPFIKKVKEKSMLMRKFRLKKAKEIRAKEKQIINQFGLSQDDIENIFDLLDEEEVI